MRFLPRSVMVGFVNALALVVLLAQLPHLVGAPWLVYPLVTAGVLVLLLLPRLSTAIPAPLVVVVLITLVTTYFQWDVPTVRDQGSLPTALPVLHLPRVPLTWETFRIIAPYSLGMALVGLMESLLTAKLIDDITASHSSKARESFGQGVANIVAGLFGSMGGCTMIGQTLINVKEVGARTRLSTLLAGTFLLALLMLLQDVVGLIPMAALVAVMLIVVLRSFDWHSVAPATLRAMPVSETVVMVCTVAVTLLSSNLAIGVVVGVLISMVNFARHVAQMVAVEQTPTGYRVLGQLFFASSNDLIYFFDYSRDLPVVVIDFSAATVWDTSAVASLDAIRQKYWERGVTVEFVGLDPASAARIEKFAASS